MRKKQKRFVAILGALLIGVTALMPSASFARTHRVRSGDTLARIARRYHTDIRSIEAANGLRRGAAIRVGQRLTIPDRGTIYVQRGDTLGGLARRHDVTVEQLREANSLRRGASLRVGQRLFLPGHGSASGSEEWGRPRQPGVVELKRVGRDLRMRMRLVDHRGRARAAARRRLSTLMQHRRSGARRLPQRRLLSVLTRISDHFGGRRISIVSGFRPPGGYTRESSRHVQGAAVDLRIRGVPNTAIRDFCRTLSRTGCGYYPNSTFVHVDVRDRATYWVDYSRPGERPRYRPRAGESTEGSEGASEDGGGEGGESAGEGDESDAADD